MERKDKLNDLRRVMGTLPDQSPNLVTEFKRGVEGISVDLVDYNVNPYKAMYILSTTCWGAKVNKWKETSPEHRFLVVKAVLEGQALPLALETPNFTFVVEGISRAGFDQMARTRLGAVFSARGMRDNNWKDASIRIPTALWPTDDELKICDDYMNGNIFDETINDEAVKKTINKVKNYNKMVNALLEVKEVYSDIVDVGEASWQAARTVLPLYVEYSYSANYNYQSLRGVCRNRMKFCEMEDVVATAWLMARAISGKFPLLGTYLRPGCDFAGKCQYHNAYSLSEMFGCLFASCGRNKDESPYEYAEFNESCSNYKDLEEQLNIHITKPNEWPKFETFEDLTERDKLLFMED